MKVTLNESYLYGYHPVGYLQNNYLYHAVDTTGEKSTLIDSEAGHAASVSH